MICLGCGGMAGLEIAFRNDPCVLDGRFANNGWLQELPKPITKLTWDNGVMLSPATAHRLGVQKGDILRLTYEGRTLEVSDGVFQDTFQPWEVHLYKISME